MNERNFVGLSVTPDGYIACGSEDDSVVAYYSALPTPLARHRFSAPAGAPDSVRTHTMPLVPCHVPSSAPCLPSALCPIMPFFATLGCPQTGVATVAVVRSSMTASRGSWLTGSWKSWR